jgi:hypothetical protein
MTDGKYLQQLDRAAAARLLERQRGVLSRDQAVATGMTDRVLRYRIRPGGPWQQILPGTYLTFTGSPSGEQLEIAAVLYAGTDSVMTGPAALRRLRLPAPESAVVDVLVGRQCSRASRDFVAIHRTRRMPAAVLERRGVAFALPARAVLDTVAGLSRIGDVRAVVAGAVQSGHCPVADLQAELRHGPRRGTALLRAVLAEVAAGIRSAPEGDLRDLIARNGLPVPMFNPRLYLNGRFLACPDAWWPAAGVAVEVDSVEWHLSPEDWQHTLRRHGRMTAAGILVLHVTPRQLRAEEARIARDIAAALTTGRPPASVTAEAAAA